MKKLEQYQCEVCGTVYNNRAAADLCEKNHKTVTGIVGTRHQPRGVNMKGYPLSIDVKMSDGTIITYKRG